MDWCAVHSVSGCPMAAMNKGGLVSNTQAQPCEPGEWDTCM